MTGARTRWTLLGGILAVALLGACRPESEGTGAGSSGSAPPADATGGAPLPDTTPAISGTAALAGTLAELPTDLAVFLFPTDAPPSSLYRLESSPAVRYAPLGEDGSFAFAETEPGQYSLVLSDGRFPLAPVLEIAVPSDATNEVRIQIEAACGYDIHVTDAGGKPAPEVAVSVLRTMGSIAYLGKTDANGLFVIEGAPIGDYQCNLLPPGARLPKPKGVIGLRHGPRGAAYFQLGESDYR